MSTTSEQLLRDSRAFCMMPWVHLHVSTRGQVQACCVGNIPFGNVDEQPIGEIWQGKAIRDFRLKMLRDEAEPRCKVCYAREAAGATSMRQETNARYAHHFPAVQSTQADGTAPDARPVYWDIRFSNLCNFRCRTCWHGASSRWYEEARSLGTTAGPQAVIHAAKDQDGLMRRLELLLPHTEEIYFAGGEPLIMPEHFRLLKALLDGGHTDIRLRYNTNLSIIGYEEHSLIKMWAQFREVILGVSLDSAHSRAEMLRKGQRWGTLRKYFRLLKTGLPDVKMEWHPTISVFNVLYLPDLHDLLTTDYEWFARDAVYLNLLERPAHYNIKVLPRKIKDAVQKNFRSHIEGLRETAPKTARQFQEVLDFMEAGQWQSKLPRFRAACDELDRMRGESVREVFPELAPLWEE